MLRKPQDFGDIVYKICYISGFTTIEAHLASQLSSLKVYRRLLKYVMPHWWAFALGVLGSIAFSGIDAYVVRFMKPLLDQGFVARNMQFLKVLPFIIMALFLLRGLASFVARYFMSRVGRDVVLTLRNEMFQHLLKMPAAYYDLSTTGQLLAKIIYNVDQVANACTNAVTTAVQSFALIVFLIAVMITINWRLTIVYLAAAPIIAMVIRYTGKRMRRLSGKVQNYLGDITQVSEEAIDGYKVVKIFGGQGYEKEKFKKYNQQNRNQGMKIVITESLSTTVVLCIGAIVLSFTIYLITSSAATTFHLTPGGFVAMIGAMVSIFKPMRNFTSVNNIIQQGVAGAESVFALLDVAEESETGTKTLSKVKGEIEYRNLSFKYQTQAQDVLHNINFKISAGQTLAFVGRSGSGKSTLINLLPRFYDITRGEIFIDGHNIYELSLENLRSNIAIVSQHVTLFNDTIANNIAYGTLDSVTRNDIEQAAHAAHAMEFIKDLPKGIDTLVGENGVLLSGGQRQRLAIARAILKDSPILILDEATSALDTESERKIQQALQNLMQDKTTLVIAHRLSTIEDADVIMVMAHGEIIESGTHVDLLNKKGAYTDLYNMQFKTHAKFKTET